MTIWRPGMKAVCIVRDPSDWVPIQGTRLTHPSSWPEFKAIYLVKKVHNFDDRPCLEFDEIFLAVWDASGFRPLVERKTDISVFQKMLTDPPIMPFEEYHKEELESQEKEWERLSRFSKRGAS